LCPSGFKEVLGQSIGQSDVVHAHGLWDPTLPPAAGLARRLGKPLVISINGVLDPPSFNRSLWKKRVAMLAVFEKVLSGAACYHASSPMEEDHLRKFGLRGPIVVMPIGVDLDAYLKYDRATSRQWLVGNMPGLKDRRVLLFLSRIHPQKGTVAMIDAWASLQREFPDWRLVVAGPDCDGHRAQLQDQAKQLACAHSVAFMDAVSGDDKSMLYAASDLFVLPSISEGFGTVVVEALASGVPVIATTGAPWQELPQHRCGWHVAPASGPLGEAMREAMSLPDEARIQAGLRGRELVMAKYCWPAIAAQMVSMYNWLRFGGSPPPQVHLE